MNTISNIGKIQQRLDLLHKLNYDMEKYISNNNINQGFLYISKNGEGILDPSLDNSINHLQYLPSYYFQSKNNFEDLESLVRYANEKGYVEDGFGVGIYNKSQSQFTLMVPKDTLSQEDIDNSVSGDLFYDTSKGQFFGK